MIETEPKKTLTKVKPKRVVALAQPKLNVGTLTRKLGNKTVSVRETLSEIITACADQPILKAGAARLAKRKEALQKCKDEVGDLLVSMHNNKQITEQIAKALISRYNLCQLNINTKPKQVGLIWFKQRVAQWAAELEEKEKAKSQTPNP